MSQGGMSRLERVTRWARETGNVCTDHPEAGMRLIPQHRCVACTEDSGTSIIQEDGRAVMNTCGWRRQAPSEIWEEPDCARS